MCMFVNVSWVLKNIHVQTATILTGRKVKESEYRSSAGMTGYFFLNFHAAVDAKL